MSLENDEHLMGDGCSITDLPRPACTKLDDINITSSGNISPNLCSDVLISNNAGLQNTSHGDTTESMHTPLGVHLSCSKVEDAELKSGYTNHESDIMESDFVSSNVVLKHIPGDQLDVHNELEEKNLKELEVSTPVVVKTHAFCNRSEVSSVISTEKQFSLVSNLPLLKDMMDSRSSDSPDVPLSSLEDVQLHPEYKTVVEELMNSKEKVTILMGEIQQLKQENEQVKVEIRSAQETYKGQLEFLDKKTSLQHSDMLKITELNQQQAEISSRNYNQMKNDLEAQLERMTKMYESANKDREVSVMRYAVNEKEVIDLKKERETLDKRMKEAVREKEVLVNKLKNVTGEKERIAQMLDVKCHELIKVQKENEKLREDLSSREIKIKWTQNKLCTEMEVHKETQTKLEKLMKKVQDTKEEAEQVRRDCQAMMKAFQTSEENKAFTLDQQLKEQQATLIMERHERRDKEESLRQLLQEMETLKGKHQVIINENNMLSIKVQSLEKDRLEYEKNLSKLKKTTDDQKQGIVDLRSQLAEMESIRIQLQHEQEKLSASHTEVERLRLSNAELQQDMAACREREAELLDFTQKLTDKNVRLQSEFSATEAKAQQLECELGPQVKHISELEARVTSLSEQLDQERQQRLEENQLLTRHLAEKTQRADSLAQQLEDQVGENQVLKRKQAATVKELMRELTQVRKRLELSETLSGSNSLGQSSRASSSTSLNTMEPPANQGITTKLGGTPSDVTQNGCDHSCATLEPDRQLLIERIVKLQRANARKSEKLEFMEEHTRQLVAELQKKSKVVQNYILREQAGALSSDTMDRNKAEVARHGGIMASVYGSKVVDDNMTLELSLEINRKLQAVLEDTLLKNITLKESIDTLGAEISRLQQNSSEKT